MQADITQVQQALQVHLGEDHANAAHQARPVRVGLVAGRQDHIASRCGVLSCKHVHFDFVFLREAHDPLGDELALDGESTPGVDGYSKRNSRGGPNGVDSSEYFLGPEWSAGYSLRLMIPCTLTTGMVCGTNLEKDFHIIIIIQAPLNQYFVNPSFINELQHFELVGIRLVVFQKVLFASHFLPELRQQGLGFHRLALAVVLQHFLHVGELV